MLHISGAISPKKKIKTNGRHAGGHRLGVQNMKAIYVFLGIICLIAIEIPCQAQQSQYQIVVPGMNKSVKIMLPYGFKRAVSVTEMSARDKLNQALESSQGGKAIVAETFSTNWANLAVLPILFVGTLPSAVKAQGRFTKDYWTKARDMFIRQSKSQIPVIASHLKSFGHQNVSATLNRISRCDSNCVIILGFSPGTDDKGSPPMLLARKLQYALQSFVLFELAVNASDSNAIETLENYLNQIDVQK